MNENNWTKLNLENHQRINCSIFINVTEFNSNNFTATIQVQSSRPIFGSTTSSPIFNFKDNQFNFKYHFKSSTELYKSGFFNEILRLILKNYK